MVNLSTIRAPWELYTWPSKHFPLSVQYKLGQFLVSRSTGRLRGRRIAITFLKNMVPEAMGE
jgi:hypothetical protein